MNNKAEKHILLVETVFTYLNITAVILVILEVQWSVHK